MNELSIDQIRAVEEFARGLRECYNNKLKNGDEMTRILMNYAIQILDIHLSLAQIKFERWENNFARAHGQ